MRRTAIAATVGLSLAMMACYTVSQTARTARNDLGWEEVLRLKRSRNYFTLRERLEPAHLPGTPALQYARAVVLHAFNEPVASNDAIARLLSSGRLPAMRAVDLRRIKVENDLRLFNYAAGLRATAELLADASRLTPSQVRDVGNMQRIFRALVGVGPQSVDIRGPTNLALEKGRLPVEVNGSPRRYVVDTGANLSTMMRSEARALGLRVVSAGIEVGTSTDKKVVADLGVADEVTVGRMVFANVVFLVLDDALLSFGDGFRIPGIIGFPVIEQMGEIAISAAGEFRVPLVPPRRFQRNLALESHTLLTPVGWGGEILLCRVDTGANKTHLYEPFYRRFRERIDPVSHVATRQIGGAGGVRTLPVRTLDARLVVGDGFTVVRSFDVLLESIERIDADNYLDCNVGHDVLDSAHEYVFNFRDMAFILR